MLENNEGVRRGTLSQLALGVGARRESPAQLPWGLVLCGATGSLTDWSQPAHTPLEEGAQGWAGG